jgi:deoxyadenosine/deoxycytidine kinase
MIIDYYKMTNYEIISIESNIGAGKSTLIDFLKDKYHDKNNIVFLAEPIDMCSGFVIKYHVKYYVDFNMMSFCIFGQLFNRFCS